MNSETGKGRFGHKFACTKNASLTQLFNYYDTKFWCYVGSSLESEELKNSSSSGWYWIISKPGHASQVFKADEIQEEQVECFKQTVLLP